MTMSKTLFRGNLNIINKPMNLFDKLLFVILCIGLILTAPGCQKKSAVIPIVPPANVTIETPNEVPDLPFGSWTSKSIANPVSYDNVPQTTGLKTVDVVVNFSEHSTKVSKYVYGNNANCFTGWMQDNSVLIRNMNKLNMGVMRIPGGSISDIFFWDRKAVYDNNYAVSSYDPPITDIPSTITPWVGRRIQNFESWSMGIDQYYPMMQSTATTGIVTVNYGYARYGTSPDPVAEAAHLAASWVRQDNGRSKFWEIGNEVYGSWEAGYEIDQTLNQDGQPKIITGDLYGRHALIFIDSMRQAAREIGKEIYIGAVCLEAAGSGMANWNKDLIAKVGGKVDFYIIHSYFTNYEENSTASVILDSPSKIGGYKTYILNELAAQGKAVAPVFLTEWNIFSQGSQQQVSFINGMHASLVLGELIRNKYEMASRWDLANGWDGGDDMGLFSYGNEPGVAQYAARPAFYYLYYFQKYFGDMMVDATSTINDVSVYASQFTSRQGGIVLVNKSNTEQVVELSLKNFNPGMRYYTFTLTGGNDNGSFSRKVYVNGNTTTTVAGGPENYESIRPKSSLLSGNIKLSVPEYAVVHLLVENIQ